MLIGVSHPEFTNVGGAELLMARYVEYLRSRGHQLRVVTMAMDATRWPQLRGAEVRVVGKQWRDGIGMPGTFPKLRRRAARQADALRGVDVVLAGNHPGCLVATGVPGAPRSVWVCMEPNRRLHPRETFRALAAAVARSAPANDTALLAAGRQLFARHDAGLGAGREIASQKALDVAATQRLDDIVPISAYSAESVRLVYGRAAGAMIPPTVDFVPSERRMPGIDPGGLRVLVHSRLELLKNVEMVLRGFASFRRGHPGAHELHIVGTGPDASRLEALARALGLDACARFHGFLSSEALAEVSARCEVMALLPPDEPFGMVFAEAALRGLLVIGPDHGGPREILDDGALGWTVDVFDPEPLADALRDASGLPIGEVGRRREAAAAACRARYGADVTLPALERRLAAGSGG